MTARPLVVADGGAAADAPEHTIAALELALEQGADGLALDVHLSRDDQPVVFRDFTLDRTTDGAGPVRASTVRDLKRLDAGIGWARHGGQRVQTLQEVFERFRGRARFWINVKGGPDVYPTIEDVVVSTIEIYDGIGSTVVQSVDPSRLAAMGRLNRELKLGGLLLRPGSLATWKAAGATEATVSGLDDGLRRELQAVGLQCFGRTTGDPGDVDRLTALGVDGIVTDRPSLVRTRLGRSVTIPSTPSAVRRSTSPGSPVVLPKH